MYPLQAHRAGDEVRQWDDVGGLALRRGWDAHRSDAGHCHDVLQPVSPAG